MTGTCSFHVEGEQVETPPPARMNYTRRDRREGRAMLRSLLPAGRASLADVRAARGYVAIPIAYRVANGKTAHPEHLYAFTVLSRLVATHDGFDKRRPDLSYWH